MATGNDAQVSFNFAVAKVASILLVVAGHYFVGSLLWIPVTVGLFVFAFSSAFFTARKYRTNCSGFWHSKVKRLAVPFLVIQCFLLALFLVTGRSGIWTWQTVVHWLGLSGWLNWLGLDNPSPFGAGMWFFTLLLIYYLLHPVVVRIQENAALARGLLVLMLLVAVVLSMTYQVGHALWMTAFGFWFGSYIALHPVAGKAWIWFICLTSGTLLMIGLNLAGTKTLNVFLLFGVAMATVLWLRQASLPRRQPIIWLLRLAPCTLPIYLIHTYLFVRLELPAGLAFGLSLLVIVTSACLLTTLASALERYFYARPAHP